MSEFFYVHNQSALQLARLVAREGNGLADLLPGEVGKISEQIMKQPRVQLWIEKKRLKLISKKEFDKHFNPLEDQPKQAYKAKVKQEEEVVVLIPGVDELPEVTDIPEPEVFNIDGSVSIRAPIDDEPLIERAGDSAEVDHTELHLKTLNEDGTLSEVNESSKENSEENSESKEVVAPKAVILKDIEPPEKQKEITNEKVKSKTLEEPILEQTNTSKEDGQGEASVLINEIVQEKAWRRQIKAVKICENPEVILAVAEKCSRKVVKEECAKRIRELT